jgi:hypothetical protein
MLDKKDISNEEWREYVFVKAIYRIEKPQTLYINKDSNSHRVVDSDGIAHYIKPKWDVIRWYSPKEEVSF